MINTYFGRLLLNVSVNTVSENKIVFNNRLAIREVNNKTTYIDVVAWDNTAKLIEMYFKKGYEILFQGHLINTKKKNLSCEFETVSIVIDNVLFTNGNPKKYNDSEIEEVEDFL